MIDYARLLRNGIGGTPIGASARGEVYNKARAALVRALKATKVGPHELIRQRLLLEDGIREVEREAVYAWRTGVNTRNVQSERGRI